MAILERGGGGLDFLWIPYCLKHLVSMAFALTNFHRISISFHGLCPDQFPPNFYRVVSYVSRLNSLYELRLNHHDINFMYIICGGLRMGYYLNVQDTVFRLISCLLDSNRNLAREWIKVSGN